MAGQGGRMTPLEWSLLGLLSVLWGGSFVFVEIGLRELAPPWLAVIDGRILGPIRALAGR